MTNFITQLLHSKVVGLSTLDFLILLIALLLAVAVNRLIVDRMLPYICEKAKEKEKERKERNARIIREAEKASDAPGTQDEKGEDSENAPEREGIGEKTDAEPDERDKDELESEEAVTGKWKHRSHIPIMDIVFSSLGKPVHILVYIIAIGIALFLMSTPKWAEEIKPVVFMLLKAIGIWCGILYMLRVTDKFKEYFARLAASTKDDKLDDMLVPLISSTIKVILIACGVLVVVQNLGYSVTSLVTGLGIGGAALALASKDTLANMFGAFVVFVDKPFQIGDWISIGSVEGEVEEIRLRTTLIRTWDNSVVTLPNSLLSTESIDNYERRKYRKMECNFGVLYSTTAEQIEKIVSEIKEHLATHVVNVEAIEESYRKVKEIKSDERLTSDEKAQKILEVKYAPAKNEIYGPNYYVGFKGFGDSSLDIEVVAFTYRTNKAGHMEDRQNFLLEIMRIVERNGTGFAFPTRTLEWAGPQSRIPIQMHQGMKE